MGRRRKFIIMADNNANAPPPAGGAAGEAEGKHIQLRVVSQDSSEVHFKIRKNTPLKRLMKAWCQRNGTQMANARFMFDGVRLAADTTAEAAGLEEGDEIDVMVEQVGGNF